MKCKIILPTNEKLALYKGSISVSLIRSKTIYTFFYKNQTAFGWITENAIGKIINVNPIKKLKPLEKIIIKNKEHWFFRCETKTNNEFPNIINKIFLKKIDSNLLENE